MHCRAAVPLPWSDIWSWLGLLAIGLGGVPCADLGARGVTLAIWAVMVGSLVTARLQKDLAYWGLLRLLPFSSRRLAGGGAGTAVGAGGVVRLDYPGAGRWGMAGLCATVGGPGMPCVSASGIFCCGLRFAEPGPTGYAAQWQRAAGRFCGWVVERPVYGVCHWGLVWAEPARTGWRPVGGGAGRSAVWIFWYLASRRLQQIE